MPSHSVLATVTLVIAGLTALSALGYAGIRPIRRALRWPLLAIAAVAALLTFVTADAGSSLLREVKTSASAAEVAAAQTHGYSADGFAIANVSLLVVVLVASLSVLRPNRERWNVGMWIGAVLLALAAVATIVTGGQVLAAALDAVALRDAG